VIHAFHVEHVQVTAQLELSQRETDSSLSTLILASLVELVLEIAQLELSRRLKYKLIAANSKTKYIKCEPFCLFKAVLLFIIKKPAGAKAPTGVCSFDNIPLIIYL